jgi:stage II sporulation protein D
MQKSKTHIKIQNCLKIFEFCFVVLIFDIYILHFNSYAQPSKYVRVSVIENVESLNLKASGSYEIIDSSGSVLSKGKNLKTTVVSHKEGILIAGRDFRINKVLIKINEPDIFIINGRKFRGNLEFIRDKNAKLSVVSHIDLEDYVKGILYHETSHYWPMEALKAQAIASRTYAVYQMQENKSKDYDLTSDIRFQVYGGKTSERYRTNKAVKDTRGIILTYKDKIFPAFFHATCGGHTQDASRLWDIDMPPLRGVTCNFCKESPHFSWHYVLALNEIKEKLIKAGYKIDALRSIEISGKDSFNRNTDLKLISSLGDIKISAKDFRNLIGSNIIRSTNFKVNIISKDAIFEGFGWGHGVGLCQWGAYFMAKQGYTAKQILRYYYPESDVKTLGF